MKALKPIRDVRSTTIIAVAVVVLGAVAGDAAMLGVVGLARHFFDGPFWQWLFSVIFIAIGSYIFFGLTQLRAWERDNQAPASTDDFRTRFSLKLLSRGNPTGFVLASLIGGPLAVGYAAGYTHDPNGRSKTFISSWIMAAVWAAIYLGSINVVIKLLTH